MATLKEKNREYKKKWLSKKENKDKKQAYGIKWHRENAESGRIRARAWIKNNRERARKKENARKSKRRKKNPIFRLRCKLRFSIIKILKRRGSKKLDSTIKLTGCSPRFLIKYLESKFRDGMTWENRGSSGWHLDHIRPCCSFDLSKESEQRACFHYTNLQPLWWRENLAKGGKYLRDPFDEFEKEVYLDPFDEFKPSNRDPFEDF